MITRDDVFTDVPPRVSRDRFVALYAGSPAMDVAGEAYDMFHEDGVEPLFAYAIHKHESDLSRNPQSVNARYNNHNPGNIRNPPPNAPVVQTDRGPFLTFLTWRDGFDAMSVHLSSPLYAGLTISDALYKWAPPSDSNDTEGYITAVLDAMNSIAVDVPQPKGKTMRAILSAGHLNIGQITADKGINPAALRTATGALGTEATPNQAVVKRAAAILASSGVQVIQTDACYHSDVYAADADLCVFVHHDGVSFGSDQPQRSGAAVVHSGPSTVAVDDQAQRFVDTWKGVSPAITGITDERTDTNDMEQYYGGWYRTASTPAVIVECSIWGGSDGQRHDVNTDKEADALATAIMQYGGINVPTNVSDGGNGSTGTNGGTPNVEHVPAGGGTNVASGGKPANTDERTWFGLGNGRYRAVAYGFRNAYLECAAGYGRSDAESGNPNPILGYPITDEFTVALPLINGGKATTVQYFERARMELHITDDGAEIVEYGLLGVEQLDALPAGVVPR